VKKRHGVWQSIRAEIARAVTRTPKKIFCKLAGKPWPCEPRLTLNDIIAPEVLDTPLFASIRKIVSSDDSIRRILEIGASSGDGSTEAFVAGVGQRDCSIYTFEISKPRFDRLKQRYKNCPQLRPFNESSVAIDDFPSPTEVEQFFQHTKTNLNRTRLEQVQKWLAEDIDYIRAHRIPQNGIARLKATAGIKTFDCVLIDGSEFTGRKEFELVYGSKYIMLDDINAFKNHANHHRLLADPGYELIEQDFDCRNGYSIFKTVDGRASGAVRKAA
jgi:hypothetical protein